MKVSELLSDGSKWCKGNYARDAWGNPCDERGKDAKSWCLLGAIHRCYDPLGGSDYGIHIQRLGEVIGLSAPAQMIDWNDDPERTYDEVNGSGEEGRCMRHIEMRAPGGEKVTLKENGIFVVTSLGYRNQPIDLERIARWIEAEGWMEYFKPGYYQLHVTDFTELPESI